MKTKKDKKADGSVYVPYDLREGEESVVYFTRDLSENGLLKMYDAVCGCLKGRVAVKLHTGEKNGPNIIPRSWVKKLFAERLDGNAAIIETNTFYKGDRYTTEEHRETIAVNGWTFCPVDIIDEEGTKMLPVKGGRRFKKMSVGSHLTDYDSMLTLTHFKGHMMGGFGGSNKNIGIGCADGRIGKKMIHASGLNPWGITHEELMEKITESTKATIDYFGKNVCYINVMRNMSVSCDCEGLAAQPVVTPNVGILASLDIAAVDTACVDLIYAMKPEDRKALQERIESRHGHRQLTYMAEMGMGSMKYRLLDLDNGGKEISAADAVKDVKPFGKDQ
ncbi:MAG: DUF362 domain-containing protein [Clostridia bacterium]|nr:DUF362 domain-containing protein [Clostridia bacterium]